VVENLGNVPLSEVQVEDDLSATFPSPALFSVDSVVASGTLVANPGYDGDGDIELLDSAASTLPLGATETIVLTVSLDLSQTAERRFQNSAFASGQGPIGQTTDDESNNGLFADPDEDGNPGGPDEDTPTPIDLGGYQPLPVPTLDPGALLLLILMTLALGAGFSSRRTGG
jgi:hypothetical protein